MQALLKTLALLGTAAFFLLGLSALLTPESFLPGAGFSLSPIGVAGLSGGRAIIGGHFLAFALVGVYAMRKQEYHLLYILSLSEGMIVIGRLLSLVLDGFDASVVGPLVVEIALASIFFCCAKYLKRPATQE